MDKDAYISELEAELALARAKNRSLYESVRSVDRVVSDFKRRHKRTYDFIRDSYKKVQSRKLPKLAGDVTHSDGEEAPLALVYTNQSVKRLNLILNRFDEKSLANRKIAEQLISATKLARKEHYVLRIISRNTIPDPKLYCDFLAAQKLTAPEQYSFYTDIDTRLASPIHRLEVSRGDVFYEDLGGKND